MRMSKNGVVRLMSAGELYYYCPGCKKSHSFNSENHTAVNRKLCFYCNKIQVKKTKIIGNDVEGRMQICEKCIVDRAGLL